MLYISSVIEYLSQVASPAQGGISNDCGICGVILTSSLVISCHVYVYLCSYPQCILVCTLCILVCTLCIPVYTYLRTALYSLHSQPLYSTFNSPAMVYTSIHERLHIAIEPYLIRLTAMHIIMQLINT